MPNISVNWSISVTSIITLIGMLFTGFMVVSNLDKINAVQDARIENNRDQIVRGLADERRQTKEAIDSLRQQMQVDKQDIVRRLEKVDTKLDKLIDGSPNH